MILTLFLILRSITAFTTRNSSSVSLLQEEENTKKKKPSPIALEKTHLLILPGFGNCADDYTREHSLIPNLVNVCGWRYDNVSVLPVKRLDWLQVFINGFFDTKFWYADASPTRKPYRWYLRSVVNEVQRIENERGSDIRFVLIGHSAGGWLARASIGYGDTRLYPQNEKSNKIIFDSTVQVPLHKILGIVSLGTPQLPPPPERVDITRGAVRIINKLFPGAYHSPQIFYVTVAGKALTGEFKDKKQLFEKTSMKGFAFDSYETVCGNGAAVGDGVVPWKYAHLKGSTQITLDGVFHSINFPEFWYGSQDIIQSWHFKMLEILENVLLVEIR